MTELVGRSRASSCGEIKSLIVKIFHNEWHSFSHDLSVGILAQRTKAMIFQWITFVEIEDFRLRLRWKKLNFFFQKKWVALQHEGNLILIRFLVFPISGDHRTICFNRNVFGLNWCLLTPRQSKIVKILIPKNWKKKQFSFINIFFPQILKYL